MLWLEAARFIGKQWPQKAQLPPPDFVGLSINSESSECRWDFPRGSVTVRPDGRVDLDAGCLDASPEQLLDIAGALVAAAVRSATVSPKR